MLHKSRYINIKKHSQEEKSKSVLKQNQKKSNLFRPRFLFANENKSLFD